jgi:hypothetical protein
MSTPFDYINAINVSKNDMMTGTDNDELAERDYNPFIVNRGLSYFPDTILYANEMNIRNTLDKKPQFAYLLNSVRPRKRFSKWFKNEVIENVSIISEFFGYSYSKAKQVAHLISPDQLLIMRQKLEKGGLKTKEKKDGNRN